MGCCCSSDENENENGRGRERRSHRKDKDRRSRRNDEDEGARGASSKNVTQQDKIFVALYDYRSQAPAELTLNKGDRVEKITAEEDDFYFVRQAKQEGLRGFVPVEFLVAESASRHDSSRKQPPERHLPAEKRDQWREIPRNQLALTKPLGEGRFGEVHLATWNRSDGSPMIVVAKALKDLTAPDRKALLDEASTMKDLRHPNVVRLHGVLSIGEPQYLVTEFVKDGSLQDYLKKRRQLRQPPLANAALIDICGQIASGMEYLSKKHLVHRDLASRNVLIDVSSESPWSSTVKVADFGLARNMGKDYVYRMRHETYIATRWLAPEGYDTIFSTDTDIWAFGVTLAEIFRDGEDPWNDLPENEVRDRAMAGRGPDKPPNMPASVYDIMKRCCQKEPKSRPRFGMLAKEFQSLK